MFLLNGDNDLATVLFSANCIRLLVKQLLSIAKIQQIIENTIKSLYFIFWGIMPYKIILNEVDLPFLPNKYQTINYMSINQRYIYP